MCGGSCCSRDCVRSQKRRNRPNWKRTWMLAHDTQSAYMNLVQELAAGDVQSYTNFFRMSLNHFDKIEMRIQSIIQRMDTNFHPAISTRERLSVTLRYLATGDTFKNLSYSFRIGASTIGQIVPETCKAIYEVLKDDYLKMPESTEEWLKIAKDFDNK